MRNGCGRRRSRLVALAGLFLLPGAAAQEPLPSARAIVDKVIERARVVDEKKLQQAYAYTQRMVLEKLDEAGKLKERGEYGYQPVWIDGARYLRLVEKNGKPIAGKDLEQEHKREREFRKRLGEGRKRPASADEPFRFDEELVTRYRAEVLGRVQVNGRTAYVLRFEPKRGPLPARRRFDRLLNRLAGRLWVDAEEHEIVKAEGSLIEPVKWGWGVMAHFQKLDFQVEQLRLEDATWMPSRFGVHYRGRVVFSTLHQRQQTTWSDFRKDPERAGP